MVKHLLAWASRSAIGRLAIVWRVHGFVLVLFSLWLAPHPAFSAPDAVQYELQERRGKRAAEVFERDHPQALENVEGGQASSSYRNHYDPNTNKCFMLQITNYFGTKNGINVTWKEEMLIDVNDNKEYGNFFKNTSDSKGIALKPGDETYVVCTVFGLVCVSESQWDEMIGRCMGDRD